MLNNEEKHRTSRFEIPCSLFNITLLSKNSIINYQCKISNERRYRIRVIRDINSCNSKQKSPGRNQD